MGAPLPLQFRGEPAAGFIKRLQHAHDEMSAARGLLAAGRLHARWRCDIGRGDLEDTHLGAADGYASRSCRRMPIAQPAGVAWQAAPVRASVAPGDAAATGASLGGAEAVGALAPRRGGLLEEALEPRP